MKDRNQNKTDSPSKRKELSKQARKIKNKRTRSKVVSALKTPGQKRRLRRNKRS